MPKELKSNEIHIYSAHLTELEPLSKVKMALLSPDELERAKRFKFDHLRQRFVLCRAILREILGQYISADPASISFAYSENGKPSIADMPSGSPAISFNVSHTENTVVFAFAIERELGIDVEKIKPVSDSDGIAMNYFSKHELKTYLDAPPEEKAKVFLGCWTRQEALAKAKGIGISAINADTSRDEWKFHQFVPEQGFVATLAYPNENLKIKEFSLDPLA
jgi:4'-phosphopantetheinyl transferase